MKAKKVLSVLLTTAMLCTALAGCGSSAGTDTSAGQTSDNAQEASAGTENAAAGSNEDLYTVTIYAPYEASTEACAEVSEKVSEITRDLINCNVELVRGVTSEQLNLALTSGEKLDLFYAFPWEVTLSSMVASNEIVAMDDLLAQYAPDMQSSISEDDWACTTVNGSIYGVPMNKDKAQARGFEMNKAIADELGIDYSEPITFEELEVALQKVKEAYPDMYPCVPNGGSMNFPTWSADVMSDSLGVLENCLEDSTQVVDLYETESFKEYCDMMYRWVQEGLMMPDGANTDESYATYISSGVGFGTFTPIKAGFEAEETRKCGVEMAAVELYAAHSTTSMVNACWAIAGNSEQPDKAMQMLNLMYTNSDVANLLINGIEGKNYKIVDESNKIINYADGIDSSTTDYSVVGWAWPNEQITYVWEGDDADVWNQLGEFNASAHSSPAKGFLFNNENVLNEVTACNNIVAKYQNGLITGCLDPDEAIPEMTQELKAAGIDTIIAEKQAQFDAWLAEK